MGKKIGFIMQSRGPEVDELMKDPNAFVLLTQIARRARRTNKFNRHNLEPGEALIGDHDSIGLSQANYRSAKRRLESYGLATFKPTNKGTIATLTDSTIYDINIDEGNDQNSNQIASKQQAPNDPADKRPTTKNNVNNENKENNDKNEREGKRTHAKDVFSSVNDGQVPQMVIDHFLDNGSDETAARKFFNNYHSTGWTVQGNPIQNWRSRALKWIADDHEKSKKERKKNMTKGDKHVEFLSRL